MGMKNFIFGTLAGLIFVVAFLLMFLAVTGFILPDKLVQLKAELKQLANIPQENSDDFDRLLDSQIGGVSKQIGLDQVEGMMFPAIITLILIASFLLYLKNRDIALTLADIFRNFRNNSIMYVVSMIVLWLIIPMIFNMIFPEFFSDVPPTPENKAMVAKFQIIITDWTKSLLMTLMIIFAVLGAASWVVTRLAEHKAKEKKEPAYLKQEKKEETEEIDEEDGKLEEVKKPR